MLIIYTDGSYNPKTKKAGWAFTTDHGTEKYGECVKFHEYRNIAGELEAILQALDYAASLGRENVIIYTDLQGAWCWAEGLWQRNNECTEAYYQRVNYCRQVMKIRFKWIKGHDGDPLNEKADVLAKKAVGVAVPVRKKPTLTERHNELKVKYAELEAKNTEMIKVIKKAEPQWQLLNCMQDEVIKLKEKTDEDN